MPYIRNLVTALVVMIASAGAHSNDIETRTVDLTVEGKKVGLTFVYQTDNGLMVAEADVPKKHLAPAKYTALTRYNQYPCSPCLKIDDFGSYFEDKKTAKATIAIRPSMMPLREIDLYQIESATAEELQRGFNLQGAVTATARSKEIDQVDGQAGLLDLSLSLGKIGVLYGGYRFSSDETGSERVRLPLYLENHFTDHQISYQLGEVQVDSDPNEPGLSVRGFRVYRNFRTRPDLTSSPMYDFYTNLQRPAVVDIYIDSQKAKSKDFTEPGPVRLSDFRPSTSGKVLLVVTDVLGSERVIEVDFYKHSKLLGEGIHDFNFGLGQVSDNSGGTVADTWAGGGSFRYGITNQFTVGASYGAVEGDSYWSHISGLTATAGLLLGSIDATARFSEDSYFGEGSSYRLSWQASKSFSSGIRVGMGLAAFQEDNYTAHFGTPRNLEGGRVYLGISDRRVSLGGNFSDLGDTRSSGAYFSYSPSSFWSWSVSYQESLDKLRDRESASMSLSVTVNLGDNPIGARAARYRASRQQSTRNSQHELTVNGISFDDHLSWSARTRRQFYGDYTPPSGDDSAELYDGYIGWNSKYLNTTYLYRKYGADNTEHLVDAATGFAIGPHFTSVISTEINTSTGIAVVDTGYPGVTVSSGSFTGTSNKRGLAAVPVMGFGRSYASIEPESLPYGAIPKEVVVDVSVYPGQSAVGTIPLAAPGVFITIPGAGTGDSVVVNGVQHKYFHTGVFTEDVVLGDNTIVHRGHTYTLEIDKIDTSFPTYEVSK